MIRKINKIIICLLVFVFSFYLCAFTVNTKAMTNNNLEVLGARIRTTGKQGLRFEAKIDSLEGVNEHGFYIALGNHEKVEFEQAIITNNGRIGENKLLKKEVVGDGLEFNAVIFDIPVEYYKYPISAIAYVVKNGKTIVANNNVTRSIAEVAIASYLDGNNNEFIKTIYDDSTIQVGPTKQIKTLTEALNLAKEGDIIILDNGLYEENVTINKNNLKIYSLNAFNDPNTNKVRKDETILNGTITLGENLKNVEIKGLKFSNNFRLYSSKTGEINNLTIKNSIFDSCNYQGAGEVGLLYFECNLSNFNFLNNKCVNIKTERFIRTPNTTTKYVNGVNISNNIFSSPNIVFEWARFDSVGMGEINVINNTFTNSNQGCIYFEHHNNGHFLIKDNIFNSMAMACFDIRGYQGNTSGNTTFEIIHNVCDNSKLTGDHWAAIRLSLAGYSKTNLSLTVNYNSFMNWGVDIVERRNGSVSEIANMDNNYIEKISGTPIDNTFFGSLAKTYNNLYNSKEELELDYALIKNDNNPVDDPKMDELLKLLVSGNNNQVFNEIINYYGWEADYQCVPQRVNGSVNNYFAANMFDIIQKPIADNAPNMPSADTYQYMKSIEFITIHDTGSAAPSSTANANSGWCVNPQNTGTAWHYTVGNDNVYQQVEDNKITWHAGDGASWAPSTTLTDTGIKADPNLRNRAKVTISNGYLYVNGIKTNIQTIDGITKTNTLGIPAVVKNGTYHIPTLHTTNSGTVVAARGGNLNSIGIETCVNKGSDVYLTWQKTAKLVASLLVKHNLTPERVVFHNTWSNKVCPQTMMRSNKTETFLDMVYLEYYILKDYSDYNISFISNNPDIIDNSGRVIGDGPQTDTLVSYKIVVSKGNNIKSITCESLVKGIN